MDTNTLMTPALTAAILNIVPATQGHIPLTLGAARYAIEHERIVWSSEGELLHPQDRTSLVIELESSSTTRNGRSRTELHARAAGLRPSAGRRSPSGGSNQVGPS